MSELDDAIADRLTDLGLTWAETHCVFCGAGLPRRDHECLDIELNLKGLRSFLAP